MTKKKMASWCVLGCLFLLLFSLSYVFSQQGVSGKESEVVAAEENHEKIIPGPKDIRERTGIYVFLGWLWLSIFVLIYFLRYKIKEVDRLYQMEFFKGKKES